MFELVCKFKHGLYRRFELSPTTFRASYEGFLNVIHPEDRDLVNSVYAGSVKNRRLDEDLLTIISCRYRY